MQNQAVTEIIAQLKAAVEEQPPGIDEPTSADLDERLLEVYLGAIDAYGISTLLLAIETIAAESEMHRRVMAQYDVLVEGLFERGRKDEAQEVIRQLLESASTDVRIPLVLMNVIFELGGIPASVLEACVLKARRIMAELEASTDVFESLSACLQLVSMSGDMQDLKRAIRLFNRLNAHDQDMMQELLRNAFLSFPNKVEARRAVAAIMDARRHDELLRAFSSKKRSRS